MAGITGNRRAKDGVGCSNQVSGMSTRGWSCRVTSSTGCWSCIPDRSEWFSNAGTLIVTADACTAFCSRAISFIGSVATNRDINVTINVSRATGNILGCTGMTVTAADRQDRIGHVLAVA